MDTDTQHRDPVVVVDEGIDPEELERYGAEPRDDSTIDHDALLAAAEADADREVEVEEV